MAEQKAVDDESGCGQGHCLLQAGGPAAELTPLRARLRLNAPARARLDAVCDVWGARQQLRKRAVVGRPPLVQPVARRVGPGVRSVYEGIEPG